MPSNPILLSATHVLEPGQEVVLEELFVAACPWDVTKRRIEIQDGGKVYFQHNFSWPPFLFNNTLHAGSNEIVLPGGTWHKILVRSESSSTILISYTIVV